VNISSNFTNVNLENNKIESNKKNIKNENTEKNKSNNNIIKIINNVCENTTNDEKTINIDEQSNIYVFNTEMCNDNNNNIKNKNKEVSLNNEFELNKDNKEFDYKNKKENEINLIKQSLKPIYSIKISPPKKITNLSLDNNQNNKLLHVKTKIENKLNKSQKVKIKNNITDKVQLLEKLMVKKLLNQEENKEQNNNEYLYGKNYDIINQKPIINKIKKKKKLDTFE
jgi:hypothetical protein